MAWSCGREAYTQRTRVGRPQGTVAALPPGRLPFTLVRRAFARHLVAKRHAPILVWDERLSTAAVTRTLIEGDASRKRRGEVIDKVAASYMLQGALDAMQERRADG